jgi:hypothetical protein
MASQTSQELLDAWILEISRLGPSRTKLDQLNLENAKDADTQKYIDDMHAVRSSIERINLMLMPMTN